MPAIHPQARYSQKAWLQLAFLSAAKPTAIQATICSPGWFRDDRLPTTHPQARYSQKAVHSAIFLSRKQSQSSVCSIANTEFPSILPSTGSDSPKTMDIRECNYDFEAAWDCIEKNGFNRVIQALTCENRNGLRTATSMTVDQWSKMYVHVYKICIQGQMHCRAPDLYKNICTMLVMYLTDHVLPKISSIPDDRALVSEVILQWNKYLALVRWTERMFAYLDKNLEKFVQNDNNRSGTHTLKVAACEIFETELFPNIAISFRKSAFRIIRCERHGDVECRALLRSVFEMFLEIGLGKCGFYFREWEVYYRTDAADFYKEMSSKWKPEYSKTDFIVKVVAVWEKEKEMAKRYLQIEATKELLRTFEIALLADLEGEVLGDDYVIHHLLHTDQRQTLKGLFALYLQRENTVKLMRSRVKSFFRKEGLQMVKEQSMRLSSLMTAQKQSDVESYQDAPSTSRNRNVTSIEDLKIDTAQEMVELWERHREIVTNVFKANDSIQKALKDAYRVIVDTKAANYSSAERFALYCDTLLSSSGRGAVLRDPDLDHRFDSIVCLLKFLSEKDVFQNVYLQLLAKRLIFYKSHSQHNEICFAGKLKAAIGVPFFQRAKRMMVDMACGPELTRNFNRWMQEENMGDSEQDATAPLSCVALVQGMRFSASVLNKEAWPTFTEVHVNLPLGMWTAGSLFSVFYGIQTANRSLKWINVLGTVTVETNLFGHNTSVAKTELSMNVHQVSILMMFNTSNDVTYRDILLHLRQTENGGSVKEFDAPQEDFIKSCLTGLMLRKNPILLKEPNGREVTMEDRFRLNFDYVSLKRRVTIPRVYQMFFKKTIEDIESITVQDRIHAVDAAIVRIMKTKKVLGHKHLLDEVKKICAPQFPPDCRVVKERIEDLIDREYISRARHDNSTYQYLA